MPGLTATMLGALLVALGPAEGGGEPVELSSAEQATEDALVRAGALWDEASARFEIPDYEGAVELYEEVYLLLLQSGVGGLERELGDLQRSLAQACVLAHEVSGDVRYLQRARIIWGRLLAEQRGEREVGSPTQLLDGIQQTAWREAQAAIERPDGDDEAGSAQRNELELELLYVEELLGSYAAEAEVESARQRDIAEAARLQLVEDERIRGEAAREEQRQRALAERRMRRARAELIAGGTLTGLGAASLGLMAGALARGASLEREGHEARADPGTQDARFDELISAGVTANKLAVAGAVIAGLSGITGVALLAHGSVLRGTRERAVLSVGMGTLEVRF